MAVRRSKKSYPLKESDIRRQIRDYLKLKDWYVMYFLAGLGAFPGLSDMAAIKDGKVLWIEIKKPGGGKQSEKQKVFQEQIEAYGGTYVIATSIDDLEGIV